MRELRYTKTLLITLSTPERGVVRFIVVAEAGGNNKPIKFDVIKK